MNLNIEPLDTIAKTAREFIQKVITPPLEEVGLLVADNVKLWRFKNQVKILEKAESYLKKNNFKTRKVALKQLVPLLEYCSFEDDESLQDKWVALLANTVTEDSQINTTLYLYILRQLSKEEAESFEYIYSISDSYENLELDKKEKAVLEIVDGKIFTILNSGIEIKEYKYFENLETILDNLIRLRLITEIQTSGNGLSLVSISSIGGKFIKACRLENA